MTPHCLVDLIVGTRPNMVKLASLHAALHASTWCRPRVVFIRQHDMPVLGRRMLDEFSIDDQQIHEVALPAGDHGRRLGAMVSGYAALIDETPPDLVLVFGDVDTTLAAAMAAKRARLPLAHIEAGLRSHDRSMPEELNRRMVDAISDLHFATCSDAVDNLRAEGHCGASVHLVGNPMIDTLARHIDRDAGIALCQRHGLDPGGFAIATFHRPSNVDTPVALARLAGVLEDCATRLPVWLPLHPRTLHALRKHGMQARFESIEGLRIAEPHGYLDFIALMSQSRLVLTDSGGLQEEASWLGIPCLTLRPNTERPVTITLGTNQLVDDSSLVTVMDDVLAAPMPGPAHIPLWDGHAGERIATVLHTWWTDPARADTQRSRIAAKPPA